MQDAVIDEIYKRVPEEQKKRLMNFRLSHPYKKITVDGTGWEYISCGQGEEALVLLSGGLRFADTWFKLIPALEDDYRIISFTYPALSTMEEYVNGIKAILESSGIDRAHILGTSFGGWIAQCFVRRYPEKVKSLILSNTSGVAPYSERLIRFVLIYVSLLPLSLIKIGLKNNYLKLISIPESEQDFWEAFIVEKFQLNTTKEDVLSQYKCTIDFNTNYSFLKDDLDDWPGKILIMESDDDPGFKEPVREALKALYPQAEVHTFHNAGHTPGYTDPGEYISILRGFLG